ncbi:MAG: diguanylate cyclase [Acidobacteriia bacterium]|nr:diguanylate cyclase [Terriglobia bacterium]
MKKHGNDHRGKRRTVRRKRTEEQGDILAHAVENSSEMIAMADLKGRLTFVNRTLLQNLGYSREEVIGKPPGSILSPANPPALLLEISTKSLQDGGWKGECLSSRSDNSTFPTFLSVGPIKDRHGRVIGSLGIAQDITERKRVEQALRESDEQFRQLAENLREFLYVLRPEPFEVVYVSPAYDEIWGRPRQELYVHPMAWMEFIHPEDREHATVIFERSMRGEAAELECRVVRKDGSLRWVRMRGFPVRQPTGELYRVVGIGEDVTQRKQAETELREAHEKLRLSLRDSEQRALEATKLTELVDVLQSCETVEEAYKIVGSIAPRILAARSGALCVTSPSRNIVEAVATWGDALATEKTFPPDSCWALRRGKIHQVKDAASPLRCQHVDESYGGPYVCVPLAAHGETLGVLYLEQFASSSDSSRNSTEEEAETLSRQGIAVGERISLALSNLRLREVLRSQSIRDPLTGLFNRRYMEESLERELRRAARNNQSVALVMMDIDHFKRFNDTFGHQAGDVLLRALGDFLMHRTRGQDVACRFGGEEFTLILSGATGGDACKRSELLQEELRHLTVQHAGQTLGKITFSIGIAAFPGNGSTAEELLRASDQALYRAKSEGRDRIVMA